MDISVENLLLEACYDVAQSTQWRANDAQSTNLDAVTPAARRYFEVAKRHAANNDPELVIRAVRFFGQAFAIPPVSDIDGWLDEGLTVLLYLFQPWDAVEGDTRAFLIDLRDALHRTLGGEPAGEA